MADDRRRRMENSIRSQMAGARKGHCTWCGKHVPPDRKTWCSDDCVHQYKFLANDKLYRPYIFAKAGGRCERCRLDLARWEKLVERWHNVCEPIEWGKSPRALPLPPRVVQVPIKGGLGGGAGLRWEKVQIKEPPENRARRQEWANRLVRVLAQYGLRPDWTMWEIDHIVPLVDGGQHQVANMQLLCRPCHAEITVAQQRARRDRPRF